MHASTSIPTSMYKLLDDNIDRGCTHVLSYLEASIRLRLGVNTLVGLGLVLIRSHPCTIHSYFGVELSNVAPP